MGAKNVILFGGAADSPETTHDINLAVEGIPLESILDADVAVQEILQQPFDLVSREDNPRFFAVVARYGRVLYGPDSHRRTLGDFLDDERLGGRLPPAMVGRLKKYMAFRHRLSRNYHAAARRRKIDTDTTVNSRTSDLQCKYIPGSLPAPYITFCPAV